MEDSRLKRYVHHAWMEWRAQHPWAMQCNVNHDDTNLTDKENCALTCQCSCALCWRCSGSWWSRCHWCRARFTTHTQYQVLISFLLYFVVHFCPCSQTVFCDRQFLPVAIYCTLLHHENGSFEVLSLHLLIVEQLQNPILSSTHVSRKCLEEVEVTRIFSRYMTSPVSIRTTFGLQ